MQILTVLLILFALWLGVWALLSLRKHGIGGSLRRLAAVLVACADACDAAQRTFGQSLPRMIEWAEKEGG